MHVHVVHWTGLTNHVVSANLRRPSIYGVNAIPVQQVLYPGMPDIPSYGLQHGITLSPVVNVDVSSMSTGSTEIRRQQRCVSGVIRDVVSMLNS